MTFVSIITIGFALFLLGGITIAYLNVRAWLKEAANRVEVVAFINDSTAADSSAVAHVIVAVRNCPQVAGYRYVDRQEAWDRFQEAYGTTMLNAVDVNPFPASIEITLNEKSQSIAATTDFQKDLERIHGIEDVRVSNQWVQLMQRLKAYFFIGTICVILLLILTLHFMIANTIKLTIYARKELVRNMHFVGATNSYIKMPFILEGILQGIIGGVLAVIILWVLKIAFLSRAHLLWGPWYSFFIIFAVGALFGCIGSMSAVRKFLV